VSANLRYLALRKRLAGLLAGTASADPYTRIVDELYRGLPHYTAIAVFAVAGEGLVLLAGHGVTEAQAQEMARGLAAATIASRVPLLIPDVSRDPRVRPISEEITAELVVPVLRDDLTAFVIDVQSERYATLGRADQELLGWLAHELQQPRPEGDRL
jgi:putative methionine-R-sulfoxide reductase with GAF domain